MSVPPPLECSHNSLPATAVVVLGSVVVSKVTVVDVTVANCYHMISHRQHNTCASRIKSTAATYNWG
jgi:hypothetical protein